MECELVNSSALPDADSGQSGTERRRYTDTFWDALPFYLSLGMTSNEYWYGDCLLVRAYRKADELNRRRQNEMLWLQGAYVYEAILDASPVLHAFSKKPKAHPYASAPYPITSEERQHKAVKDERKRYEAGRERLKKWMETTNQRMKLREEAKHE